MYDSLVAQPIPDESSAGRALSSSTSSFELLRGVSILRYEYVHYMASRAVVEGRVRGGALASRWCSGQYRLPGATTSAQNNNVPNSSSLTANLHSLGFKSTKSVQRDTNVATACGVVTAPLPC
jgi:hypothetical protein